MGVVGALKFGVVGECDGKGLGPFANREIVFVGCGEVCAGYVGAAVCYGVGGGVVKLGGEAAGLRRLSWVPYFFCLGAVGEEPPISLALGTVDD